ncbi:expressed unknown protein [Seminavis robusta]|uniref:Uncharacterized protein n=1 Tax=Seminavis robusta TaxID=568900 RepID=A0A9N8E5P5_9STRA|nr:expressed unknown protein [Seminavis robusta]|eukprot:Sro568_g168160.1 n/a (151) ;mRNA; r:28199-28820
MYDITFNFAQGCPQADQVENAGIGQFECLIETSSEDVTDLVPTEIQIQIIELDQSMQIINHEVELNYLVDGDTYTFAATTGVTIGGMRFVAQGFNQVGQLITLTWSMEFTNDCSVFPVLSVGDFQGWTMVTAAVAPQALVCPAAAVEATP